MRDIAVAVTLYNNEKEVIEFAKGLLKQTVIDRIQLIVTCNACKNIVKFRSLLIKELPSAMVFDPKENLGYLNGCLFGVNQTGFAYSWVMISNTDIEFMEDNFFEKALMNVGEDVWCIGSDIILSTSGTHQNPFLIERPSRKKMLIWKTVYSAYSFFWLYFKLSELKSKKVQNTIKKNQFVYAVHGSCFFLRNECAKKISLESKRIFMYGEELLVAESIHKNNKKCLFNSKISIVHNENQVTSGICLKRKQKWFDQSFSFLCNFYQE